MSNQTTPSPPLFFSSLASGCLPHTTYTVAAEIVCAAPEKWHNYFRNERKKRNAGIIRYAFIQLIFSGSSLFMRALMSKRIFRGVWCRLKETEKALPLLQRTTTTHHAVHRRCCSVGINCTSFVRCVL